MLMIEDKTATPLYGESELRNIYWLWRLNKECQEFYRRHMETYCATDERDDAWIDDIYVDIGGEG